MKRTNLVLDEHLLKTAVQLLNARTYSAAVNKALEEAIRTVRIRNLANFMGSDLWEGDLSEMREDKASSRPKRKK